MTRMIKRAPVLKSKRGVAVESAISFLMIISLFCFLMTSIALSDHYSAKIDRIVDNTHWEREQLSEDFLIFLRGSEQSLSSEDDIAEEFVGYLKEVKSYNENYSYNVAVDPETEDAVDYTLTVFRKSGDAVLYLKARRMGGNVTLLSRHAPKTIE